MTTILKSWQTEKINDELQKLLGLSTSKKQAMDVIHFSTTGDKSWPIPSERHKLTVPVADKVFCSD